MYIKCCLSNCNIDEFTIYYKVKEVFYIRFIYRSEYMSQVFKQDLTDDSVRPGGLFFVELLMPGQCDMPDAIQW